MREAIVNLLTATSSRHSRGQIAAALVIGVFCGLLPKSSGLFYAMLAILYFLPVHLLLTLAVTAIVGIAVQPLAQFFDRLGSYSLTHPRWSEFWLELDTFALVPWLGLHNTVVHGALLCAAILLLPLSVASHFMLAWLMPRRRPQPLQWHSSHRLPAVAVDQPQQLASIALPILDTRLDPDNLIDADAPAIVDQMREDEAAEVDPVVLAEPKSPTKKGADPLQNIEQMLSRHGQIAPQDSRDVLRRASQLVDAVDDLLHAVNTEQDSRTSAENTSAENISASVPEPSALQPHQGVNPIVADVLYDIENREPMFQSTYAAPSGSDPRLRNDPQHALLPVDNHRGSDRQPTRGLVKTPIAPLLPRRSKREGEVLRNLLHHLRELKEKV